MEQDFTQPIYLGDGWAGQVWAIYAGSFNAANAFGDMLLFKGTETECSRLYARWTADPSAFDTFIFEHRDKWWT